MRPPVKESPKKKKRGTGAPFQNSFSDGEGERGGEDIIPNKDCFSLKPNTETGWEGGGGGGKLPPRWPPFR